MPSGPKMSSFRFGKVSIIFVTSKRPKATTYISALSIEDACETVLSYASNIWIIFCLNDWKFCLTSLLLLLLILIWSL